MKKNDIHQVEVNVGDVIKNCGEVGIVIRKEVVEDSKSFIIDAGDIKLWTYWFHQTVNQSRGKILWTNEKEIKEEDVLSRAREEKGE